MDVAGGSVRRAIGTVAAGLLAALLTAGAASAQELEPRAYSPSPVGTTFLVITATHSTGGVFTDPSVILKNVEAQLDIGGVGIGHSFALLGKSALVLGVVPITWAAASGEVGENRRETSRRGLADSRVKLSVNLAGAKPMRPAEFVRAPRRPILGASVTIIPPLGQYDPAKLINLGSNRWAFKPEVGLSVPVRRWTFDSYAGVWLFTDNQRYYPGGAARHQDAVVALQGHVSYTLYRRAWVAGNATWYAGGRSSVDGVLASGAYSNTRFGVTLAVPVASRQSIKVAYSTGAATRLGADFRTVTVGWQLLF